MVCQAIKPLLRCPATRKELVFKDLPPGLENARCRIINPKGKRTFDEPVEKILGTPGGDILYPVVKGVPFLLREAAVYPGGPAWKSREILLSMDRAQVNIEKFHKNYDKWYKKITQAQIMVQQEHFYPLLPGRRVLDIGNGGLSPSEQLGDDISGSVEFFIPLDRSFSMLFRNGPRENQILADGMHIPLAENSVDYALFNGVIHHLGLKAGENAGRKLGAFFLEGLRVAEKGIIVMEMVVPGFAEKMENLLLKALGRMPTFAYSRNTLLKALRDHDLVAEKKIRKSISDLLSPWDWVPPVLELEKLILPAFSIPYSFLFFLVTKKPAGPGPGPGSSAIPSLSRKGA